MTSWTCPHTLYVGGMHTRLPTPEQTTHSGTWAVTTCVVFSLYTRSTKQSRFLLQILMVCSSHVFIFHYFRDITVYYLFSIRDHCDLKCLRLRLRQLNWQPTYYFLFIFKCSLATVDTEYGIIRKIQELENTATARVIIKVVFLIRYHSLCTSQNWNHYHVLGDNTAI